MKVDRNGASSTANASVVHHGAQRIAIVLPAFLPLAGVERAMLSMSLEFTARGYAVDLVLACEPEHAKIRLPGGARVFEFAVPRLRSFVFPFTRYLRQTRPDAVLVSLWPLTSICCIAHRLARSSARLVVCDHNNLSMQYKPKGLPARLLLAASIASTYRLADGRVAVSEGVAGELSSLSGIAKDKFGVIYNPMPLSISQNPDYGSVEAAWKGWRGPRILTIGRLKPQKNHPLLIRAFRRLREKLDARLMIIGGGGESEKSLERLLRAEGVQNDVILVGDVDDPGPFYERTDLFVLSSDYEGFGNVLIEALAFGCPIVSTDCPYGPAEILENGRWGRLTPTGDADALSAAMIEALTAANDRDALKRRAADFVPAKVAEQYLKILLP